MDLTCLPVFLSGCNQLLVIAGETYTYRLWCMFELFVYHNLSQVLSQQYWTQSGGVFLHSFART